eukprot:3334524-Prymnesium_polylepis.1
MPRRGRGGSCLIVAHPSESVGHGHVMAMCTAAPTTQRQEGVEESFRERNKLFASRLCKIEKENLPQYPKKCNSQVASAEGSA